MMTWEEARKQTQIDVETLVHRFQQRKRSSLCPEVLAIRVLLAKTRIMFKQIQRGENGARKNA
jgi:hypothetical protein